MTLLRGSFIDEYRKRTKRPVKVDPDGIADTGIPPEARESDPAGRFPEAIVDAELIPALQDLDETRVDAELRPALQDLDETFRVPPVLSDIEMHRHPERCRRCCPYCDFERTFLDHVRARGREPVRNEALAARVCSPISAQRNGE